MALRGVVSGRELDYSDQAAIVMALHAAADESAEDSRQRGRVPVKPPEYFWGRERRLRALADEVLAAVVVLEERS